jgi:hypothetical protein
LFGNGNLDKVEEYWIDRIQVSVHTIILQYYLRRRGMKFCSAFDANTHKLWDLSSCAVMTFLSAIFWVVTMYCNSVGGYWRCGGTNRCTFSLGHVTKQRTTMWAYKNFSGEFNYGLDDRGSEVNYWQCGKFIIYSQRLYKLLVLPIPSYSECWGLLP